MAQPSLLIMHRNLPHWRLEGSTYFVTFRTKQAKLDDTETKLVRDHLASGHRTFYRLAAAVVMPDHVHLLLHPRPGIVLSRIMKGIKGASAHKVNTRRGVTGAFWLDESWDRIVRDESEFDDKMNYLYENPIKEGLTSDPFSYCGWFHDPHWLEGDWIALPATWK